MAVACGTEGMAGGALRIVAPVAPLVFLPDGRCALADSVLDGGYRPSQVTQLLWVDFPSGFQIQMGRTSRSLMMPAGAVALLLLGLALLALAIPLADQLIEPVGPRLPGLPLALLLGLTVGYLLEVHPLAARQSGSSLVAGGRWPKVTGWLGLDTALGVAAVVDAGLVAVPLKRGIR